MMGANPFSYEANKADKFVMSDYEMAKTANYEFEKYGGFETGKVEEFEQESISMFSTKTRKRDFKRKKVVHCGEVPYAGQTVLMCERSYNDISVCVGISSWTSE